MDKSLPPGNLGLPLIGETLAFVGDGFKFVDSRARTHGRVFKSSVLFHRTVVISGPNAAEQFLSGDNIQREGAMPPHFLGIFGGRSLPLLDGSAHTTRKKQVLQGFGREQLAAYLPMLERRIALSFERWRGMGEFAWLDELRRLAFEGIIECVFGVEPGPVTDSLRADYATITRAATAVPINLPGTPLRRAFQARERVFAQLQRWVAERRTSPRDDGLSAMLKPLPEGGALSDEEAVLELFHVVIAGFIVFAEFARSIIGLHESPEVRKRLEDEVRALPAGPLSPTTFGGLPYLARVIMETKRLTPILPVIFGIAKRDFVVEGQTVPEGWRVFFALSGTHMDPQVYRNPERFDPERFTEPRNEHLQHAHAFVPHGPGPALSHRCPGMDFSTVFMGTFLVHLARQKWSLPAQDLALDSRLIPPEPRDGLRARVGA